MAEEYISRQEHEEFIRRIETEHRRLEDEDSRQNNRLKTLESSMQRVTEIHTSVEKLAVNMESMLKEQVSQGQRIANLEATDGDMWRSVVKYAITVAIGLILGFLFTRVVGG